MPELQKKKPSQDPANAPHLRHPREAERLKRHIEHFRSAGDEEEAKKYEALLAHTTDRSTHASTAVSFVSSLGLSHDITPETITHNDALAFVSKQLHEQQHAKAGTRGNEADGPHRSIYARAHLSVVGVNATKENESPHADKALMAAPRDFAAETIEHLALTNESQIAACKALFG